MFVRNLKLFLCSILVQTVFGVDVDYYYSTALRSKGLSCINSLQQLYCQVQCETKSAFCISNDCYCLSLTSPNDPELQIDETKSRDVHENLPIDNEPYPKLQIDETRSKDVYKNLPIDNEPYTIQNASPETDLILYAIRPTLRHHIAHFCPNLEVARECIKKCMTVGKPAFCGKDHICYCGHKYSNTDDDTTIDAKDMYAQFKDLYIKYFGSDKDSEEYD